MHCIVGKVVYFRRMFCIYCGFKCGFLLLINIPILLRYESLTFWSVIALQ